MRKSKQRDTVLESVRALKGTHPTAESVCAYARRNMPNISLGTVYRNLNALTETGQILKVETHDGDRFDGTIENHAHAICAKCGTVFDLPVKQPNSVRSEAKRIGFSVSSVSLTVVGICSSCKKAL